MSRDELARSGIVQKWIEVAKSRLFAERKPDYVKLRKGAFDANDTEMERVFECMVHLVDGKPREAETVLKEALKQYTESQYLWFAAGDVNRDLGKSKKAFAAYRKSLEYDDGFVLPHFGLGYLYLEDEEFKKAIQCLRSCLDMEPQHLFALYNMAQACCGSKKYKDAVFYYNKAKKVQGGETVGSEYGLGYVYWSSMQYSQAIASFKKALKIDNDHAHAWNGLANAYFDDEKYSKAQKAYEKFLDKSDKKEDRFYRNGANARLQEIKYLVESLEVIEREGGLEDGDICCKVLKATRKKGRNIEKAAKDNKHIYYNFFEKPRSQKSGQVYWEVLRRWNSYTPIIRDNFHVSKGGGYFLKVGEYGIVVDPGFNFIDNFKGAKHVFSEISSIFITHAHNDHTADLESILTLLFEYNEMLKGDPESGEIIGAYLEYYARQEGVDPRKVDKDELSKAFNASDRCKKINIYMTNSTAIKYSGMLSLKKKEYYKIHVLEPGDEKVIDDVRVKVIPAKHRDVVSDRDSVGFVFSVEDVDIIYTGDTGWDDDVEESYGELMEELGEDNNYTLLVAHIGGFEEAEKLYGCKKKRKDSFYEYHLGRLGLSKINELIQPDVCFISEFGEELKGHRIELADIYNEAFQYSPLFFAADIGLKINLQQKRIRAYTTADRTGKRKPYQGWVQPERVKTTKFWGDFSLHYYDGESEKIDEKQLQAYLGKTYNTRDE